ncbi:MAG: hypothetical protein ABMA64_02485 [Myxococcota bacterium]
MLLFAWFGCGGSLDYYGKPTALAPTDPTTSTPPVGTTPTGTPAVDTGSSTVPTPTSTSTPSVTSPTTDTGTPPAPWADGDPELPPPYGAPPPQNIGVDCGAAGGLVPALDDDEVDVLSYDPPEVRTLTAPVSGWFDLYDEELSHEEDDEWNESAMVRVSNLGNPTGLPALANCDSDWVAVDPDNFVDSNGDLLYFGTFWVEAGPNTLELEHLCPRVRAGSCANLEFVDDRDTTCSSGDGNSAHLDGERLCLVPAAP